MPKLTVTNHNQIIEGLTYVYPVISRRAGGLSIGINFNPNNACNWRCIYCQVPNLTRGSAPEIDLTRLEKELRFLLDDVLHGDFYERFEIPENQRVIKDIAIAGNGEPTSLKTFDLAIKIIGQVATELGIFPESKFILITNGSLIHRLPVQNGLKLLKNYGGEVWLKIDSASPEGKKHVNNAVQSIRAGLKNLILACELCPTKLQICLVDYKNQGFKDSEKTAFLDVFTYLKQNAYVKAVTIYTIARPSQQPEANDLKKMPYEIMMAFANELNAMGYDVNVIK